MPSILDDIEPPFTIEQRNAIALEFDCVTMAAARRFWHQTHERILGNDHGITGLNDIEQMARCFALESIPRWKPDGGKKMKGFLFQSVWLLLKKAVMERRKGLHIPNTSAIAIARIHSGQEPREGTKAWIFQVAEKLAALEEIPYEDVLDVPYEDPAALDRIIEDEDRKAFWSLANLIERDSMELLRRYYGLDRPKETLEEIAADTGVSRQATHWKLTRARKRLRESLGPIYGSTA